MEEDDRILAAVDLGSNSFHMIVVRIDHGQLKVLDDMREPVRLGAGLDERNCLMDDAIERGHACLTKFGQRLRDLHPNNVRVVGTNTLRKARNSSAFMQEAESLLGHPIEIISGIEEARLIYLGVSHNMADAGGKNLVVDIGGGSTEVIIGEQFEPLMLESLYMGCVSMSRLYFPDGEIQKGKFQKAEIAARLELEGVVSRFKRMGWSQSIGASGTAKAIEKVVNEEAWCEQGITYKSLKKLRKELLDAGHVDKLNLKGLSNDRKPVFAGGVAIMLAIFETLQIDLMLVSSGALREGLIYDMIGELKHEDIRVRTVDSIAKRYHVDEAYANQVSATALSLFSQVKSEWQLKKDDDPLLLTWAARLHEIGLDIAHNQYHKHGSYLAENLDMPGFSRSTQKLLAFLVRGHRRKFPVNIWQELPAKRQQAMKYICILLRIAVKLNHSRSPEQVPEIHLSPIENGLLLRFPSEWLDVHPLTREDLEREAGYLKAIDFELKLE